MLVGLIADVHSNAVALKAILSDFKKEGVGKIIHAGDVVGYNPYPNEVIDLFNKNRITSILGNHDRALIDGDTSWFNQYAAAALEWTGKVISHDNLVYISRLKNTWSITLDGIKIFMVHGSPRNFDEYIYPEDVMSMSELLSEVDADVLVLGHTHVQFKKEYPSGTIVNPGSTGQPRDGNPDAGFAILDAESGKVTLKRIGYDVEKVIEDILTVHLPEKIALRLRAGL
jgi:putative phosphoesterase